MVRHIVFFRLKDEAHGHNKLYNALHIKHGLEALREKIPFVRYAHVGINIPNKPRTNYDIALVCDLDNFDDLAAYHNHPEHLKVSEYIAEAKLDRSAVDYEL